MRLSDISLSRRIAVTFTAGIIIIVSSLLFIVHNLTRISNEADILQRPRHDSALLAAEVAHLAWANAVQSYLLKEGKSELTVPMDGHKCGFGTWFYGQGRAAMERELPATTPFMRKIDKIHLDLHTSAITIKNAATQGDLQQAHSTFENVTMPLLTQVQDLLRESYTVCTNSTRTTVVTLGEIISFSQSTAYIMCIVIGISGIVIAFLFGRSITVPMTKLVNYAGHISRGE